MNIAERLPANAKAWYLAARPRSLTATYAPLFVGASIAVYQGVFDLARFVLALIGALLLQIGANLVNEYVDYKRGTDTHKVDGMGMVLTRGQLTHQQVLAGAVITITGGALIGLLLMAYSGILLLWIGLGGVFVVIFYTAGPLPLSYIGLGELAVFIFMGPAMTLGTYYAVSGGQFSAAAVWGGLPIAFTVANILHANNMRDIDSDRLAGKQTLAVRLGLPGAKWEFAVLLYGAYVAALLLIVLGQAPWPTALILGTLPGAIALARAAFAATEPAVLHRIQGMTAQLHLRIGVALAVGWLISALLPK
ncbi:MAG TPA: 1,4-dihydroxy-2-naphthoate octaprenyltransferase [Aggregatilineales bacterium]|nr:1,4-dihydroxy-2-naphthoate octaprenyltransferase [Aggregatilineales bacterium]